jgi:hypothetical protein
MRAPSNILTAGDPGVLLLPQMHLGNAWAEQYFKRERSIRSRRVRNLRFVIRLRTYGLAPCIIGSHSLRMMGHSALGSASLLMETGDSILPFNRYTYDLRLFYYSFYYFWLINYIPVKYVRT